MLMLFRRTSPGRLALIAGGLLVALGLAGYLSVSAPSVARARLVSAQIMDSQGHLLRTFGTPDGTWRLPVRLEDVSPLYIRMLISYEDHRFFSHPGVDPLALTRATWQAVWNGHVVSGASTITMQVVRLLDPKPMSVAAKLRQMAEALALERSYGKREILELYLTLAPFGGNLEGVRAASLAYFGKEPRRLTVGEAALLVALPQSPLRRPDRRPEAARAARDKVLQRLVSLGVITSEMAGTARLEDIPAVRMPMPDFAAHLSQTLRAEAEQAEAVTTLVDRPIQDQVVRIIKARQNFLPPAANAAAIVVRNRDAAVVAYVGSIDFNDASRNGEFDYARAVRSPGSTLKPFIYGLAFETLLIHPETLVDDLPTRHGTYSPENFEGGFGGVITAREALLRSVNTVPVDLLNALVPSRLLTRMRSTGVTLRIPQPDAEAGLAVAVGGCGISLEDLVRLYAGLANHGLARPLRYRQSDPEQSGVPLLTREAAWAVADILASMQPPGAPGGGEIGGQRRVAFKTGTSASFRDALAVGFDADHTVGVWIGRPDSAPMPGSFGGATAAPLLFQIFDILPDPHVDPAGPPPPGTPLAARADLPPRLVRFSRQPTQNDVPMIDVPAEGAEIWAGDGPVSLRGHGGQAPFRWMVNGRPLGAPSETPVELWYPSNLGGARLELVDGNGRAAMVNVWIAAVAAQ
ncbi:penicillin-binding protein 1C [Inquilinus sp. CA228]|uniref:penicillin-binding protein 1C n=1 Tax=Inquilinus sp. CA228 TaxID=3455609 RepID=UPI003F8CF803